MIRKCVFAKISSWDRRTFITRKNIFYSFFVKSFGVFTSLLLVPITLKFLNPTEYGIWITLNSILLWINSFDIGLGNGLRNKLAESFAEKDFVKAKHYISTAYVVIFIIMSVLFCLFQIVNYFIDWNIILNVSPKLVPNLRTIISLSFALFCLTFVLKLIGSILLAMQKAALENLLIMLGQVLSLIIIFILSLNSSGTLLQVALIYSICPAIIYALSYIYVFKGEYNELFPRVKFFKMDYAKTIMSLGVQFFVLQIAALIIFSTSNLIISYMFGPEMVTKYNIAFRYFNVIPLLFTIILTPMWSATTDAFKQGDFTWITKSMKKINILLLFTLLLLIIMTLVSDRIYTLWVGNEIGIPLKLSVSIAIYVFLLVASLSYSSFLNGLGKLRVQMINIVICSIFFLPLTFYFGNKLGIYGIIVSLSLVNLSGLILNVIQYNIVVRGNAKGIWNK
ncbi:oligosaccharide flippase family protein [Chryseobacterium salipaludis]|uniref:lipopolysaccharide biosynthesis protein n=1 Tax=Chryseobacterium TaxID=59732 RepID=UPI001FF662AA|nr:MULTISPECIES: oligosaccharide flippase family protein [Chryseobacterium]MCJ8497158.1 oligosaccharide flippase family protein [Chryseobacterium salipaludis]MCX3296640.1 oligosaccharide flippase family protein [Planobacterium sp. JC490]